MSDEIDRSNRMARAQAFREAAGIVLGPGGISDEMPEDHDSAAEWVLRRSLALTLTLKAEGEQEDW